MPQKLTEDGRPASANDTSEAPSARERGCALTDEAALGDNRRSGNARTIAPALLRPNRRANDAAHERYRSVRALSSKGQTAAVVRTWKSNFTT